MSLLSQARTASKNVRRSPYQALAAIMIMGLTFFVATVLAILAYASYSTLKYFETRPQIIAYLKNEATPEAVSLLQRKLDSDPRIKSVTYVSKEQALEIYKEATSDNPLLSELVSPRVFPASLEFSVKDLSYTEQVVNEVQEDKAVKEVDFTASLGSKNIGDVVDNLRKITDYIRLGGLVILSFLLTSSLLILLVILGMKISSRRDEIRTLQLIGATPGFIRAPFVFEALFYSIFGSFLGWIFASTIILYLAPTLSAYFGEIPALPSQMVELFKLFGAIFGVELVLSCLLGFAGSFMAIRHYLKV